MAYSSDRSTACNVSRSPHRFCVAPMMDLTDRHARFLLRLLSRNAMLYTEMITTGALIHGDASRHLKFDPSEHPVAIQLGGADPDELAACAEMAAAAGYDEVNLNVGCPSDRVQSGRFGACLMAEPETVAKAVRAMCIAVKLPITVKTRIGIDQDADSARLVKLTDAVESAGAHTIIVHARNAWLKGLSPKENREIPPLKPEVVYGLKRSHPQLEIVLNGGIRTISAASRHLIEVDGVMLGREAYYNPYVLATVDRDLFGSDAPIPDRADVVDRYLEYVEEELESGTPLTAMTRHLLGLYHGQTGARTFRRIISESPRRKAVGTDLVREALAAVEA